MAVVVMGVAVAAVDSKARRRRRDRRSKGRW
jgi:hypothetical protein